jgi:hypothetical protein
VLLVAIERQRQTYFVHLNNSMHCDMYALERHCQACLNKSHQVNEDKAIAFFPLFSISCVNGVRNKQIQDTSRLSLEMKDKLEMVAHVVISIETSNCYCSFRFLLI